MAPALAGRRCIRPADAHAAASGSRHDTSPMTCSAARNDSGSGARPGLDCFPQVVECDRLPRSASAWCSEPRSARQPSRIDARASASRAPNRVDEPSQRVERRRRGSRVTSVSRSPWGVSGSRPASASGPDGLCSRRISIWHPRDIARPPAVGARAQRARELARRAGRS